MTTPPPIGGCPGWCEKPAQHGWEDEWLNGPVRVHIWARAIPTAGPRHPDEIRVEETEQHTAHGVVRRRTVVLDVEAPTDWDLGAATAAHAVLGEAITLATPSAEDPL